MQISFAQLYEAGSYTCKASTSDGKILISSPVPLAVTPRKNIALDLVTTLFEWALITPSLVQAFSRLGLEYVYEA